MNTNNELTKRIEVEENDLTRFNRLAENQPHICEDGLLDNINSTPLGRLLKLIGSLPDIRYEKVQTARDHIDLGQYDCPDTLDEALDRVLEELVSDS